MGKNVNINVDINLDDVLEKISESDIVSHYGAENLLEEMNDDEIEEECERRGVARPQNLLEVQLLEAFKECCKHSNNLQLLWHLEDISKNGIPNLQKV